MRLAPLAVALLLPVAPLQAQEAEPAHNDGIKTFELENGLKGIVIEDHRAPVVTHMVWYKVGAAEDPPGVSGLAHYLEHLMFKGTDELGEGEFSRIVSANGGEDNAFTSYDYTGYFQRIAADRLELVMEMEADRMSDLAPPPASAIPERAVVLEERRQVVENRPGGVFNEERRAMQFINHPYGRPVIGWMNEVEDVTLADALAFYETYYTPNNAFLVVAGDVTVEEVEALAAKHYGPIPANPDLVERKRTEVAPQFGERRVQLTDPRVQNPYVIRTYLADPRRAGNQEEAAALTVLAEVLGRGITSVLSRELRVEDDFALDAGAFFADTALDQTTFGVYVTPNPGVPLAEAEARMDSVIADFLEEGVDPAQLERIKAQLRASEIYARDNLMGRARQIGGALTAGLTLEDVRSWPEALDAVTAEDVMIAAESMFRQDASVTGYLLGTGEATPGAGAAVVIEGTEVLSE